MKGAEPTQLKAPESGVVMRIDSEHLKRACVLYMCLERSVAGTNQTLHAHTRTEPSP